MRFVAVKSEAKQASAVIFRTRDLLVGQQTQLVNAIRGHMAELGYVAPQGPSHIELLIAAVAEPTSTIPDAARQCLLLLVETLQSVRQKIKTLDEQIGRRAKRMRWLAG